MSGGGGGTCLVSSRCSSSVSIIVFATASSPRHARLVAATDAVQTSPSGLSVFGSRPATM